MSLKKTILYFFILLFLGSMLLTAVLGYHLTKPANPYGGEKRFVVRPGASLSNVTEDLVKAGLMEQELPFLVWARFKDYGKHIKAGEYRLKSNMNGLEILEVLKEGWVVTYSVTIPEGFTARQIGVLLEKGGLVRSDAFVEISMDSEVAKQYGLTGPSLEGFLFPDTYHFARGLQARAIVDSLVQRFFQVVEPFKIEIEASGKTIEEVVTLASIVEKETGKAEERALIASVFLNRLKRKMRLESDPTVIYGIEDFDGNLTRKHLTTHTPYNTYTIRGLPPGPIANPGKQAIAAVLRPEQTDYLYFVSKNDGTHFFSKTYQEHNRAVQTYQKKGGSRRQKSP